MVAKGLRRLRRLMRICLVYDCLFPYTVGGAERWYRNLGERLAADGHEVTLPHAAAVGARRAGDVPGIRVVAVGPRMGAVHARPADAAYCRRSSSGWASCWHLLRHGRALRRRPYRVLSVTSRFWLPRRSDRWAASALVVDWFEVWSRDYWIEYLGPVGGRIGTGRSGALPARAPASVLLLAAARTASPRARAFEASSTVLEGLYAGPLEAGEPAARRTARRVCGAAHPREAGARARAGDRHCVRKGDGRAARS